MWSLQKLFSGVAVWNGRGIVSMHRMLIRLIGEGRKERRGIGVGRRERRQEGREEWSRESAV